MPTDGINNLTAKMDSATLQSPAITRLVANGSHAASSGASTPNSELSRVGSEGSLNRIRKDTIGYKATSFPEKDQQMKKVEQIVLSQGFLPRELVKGEVEWYYQSLGIDNTYFAHESPAAIADHVLALYSSKLLAYTKHDPSKLAIDLETITTEEIAKKGKTKKEGAVFIHSSVAGVKAIEGPGAFVERRIDEMYLDDSNVDKAFRLETYRSTGAISTASAQQLRCYFITRCVFPENVSSHETDIRLVSDKAFLERASDSTLEIYQNVMNEVTKRSGPVIELYEVEESREQRIVIGYKMGGTKQFFSALSDLYHFYGLFSARKYVEQFANGITIISMYLNPMSNTKAPPIEHSIHQVVKEASLLYCLPDNPFFAANAEDPESVHAVQEATYAYVGWIFAQHFCNRLGPSYLALKNILDENNVAHAEALQNIRTRLRDETFTRQFIMETMQQYPSLVRMLYINMAMTHYPGADEAQQLTPTISFQRLKTEQPLSDSDLLVKIRKNVSDENAVKVFETLLIFNKHILKTNFYQPTKVALSFKLKPDFLSPVEYPVTPYGIFFVVGSDFRGFHCRFKDVARGGIRIVRSRGREDYSKNVSTLFFECWNLANTQQKKNKDIPEGGSKGTILPNLGADRHQVFKKYVDSLLDLLLEGNTPGIKGPIMDVSGRTEPEILFLGPDENTADLMDWAAMHAAERQASFWKSFTTGKTASTLGGIPHDKYGMTSLSVRQYMLGVYKGLGWREEEVTKILCGGPDGDLGSNDIKLSKDKTIAIVDGYGVIHDPRGIDRAELLRLANARAASTTFDRSKLSPDGYIVAVDDIDVTLPSGEVVANGTAFRNSAHFRYKADIMVPCGGRPETINIGNVNQLFSEGKCNVKAIVEGANLYISPQARLYLEKRGIVLFKDASTNKGGVTSSSLEVLAGLALTDEEYLSLMLYQNGQPTEFYNSYVAEIQQKIIRNAALEYESIEREFHRLGRTVPRTKISDQLSQTLNDLQAQMECATLYDDVSIRKNALKRSIPKVLVDKVGLDVLMERLPEAYLRSMFAASVSTDFIYTKGLQASLVDFYLYFRGLDQTSV